MCEPKRIIGNERTEDDQTTDRQSDDRQQKTEKLMEKRFFTTEDAEECHKTQMYHEAIFQDPYYQKLYIRFVTKFAENTEESLNKY